mmetsp:Transcript_51238/g.134549  ORF Transcript_51238/g.134549 Transcript_51238/m.134549 type:complete len:269 (+) Transcript_51238:277-1083(+)
MAISTLCSSTKVLCRTGAPFTMRGASGAGFRRNKQGGSHAISKRCSQGKGAKPGINCLNACGCWRGPTVQGCLTMTRLPTQRCVFDRPATFMEAELMHSKTTSMLLCPSIPLLPSHSCATTESIPRARPPSSSAGIDGILPKISHCGTWAPSSPSLSSAAGPFRLRTEPAAPGRHSATRAPSGSLASSAAVPTRAMPMRLLAAAPAVSQICRHSSTSLAFSLTASAVSEPREKAVRMPSTSVAPVPARLATQPGSAPTPTSLQKMSQK